MKDSGKDGDHRRAIPVFLRYVLLCVILGIALGFLSSLLRTTSVPELVKRTAAVSLRIASLWGIPFSSASLLLPGLSVYRAANKRLNAWKENGGTEDEGEEIMDQAEETLNRCYLLLAVAIVLNLFFFAASQVYLRFDPRRLWTVVFFILSIAATTALQQKVLDLRKRMNPEKQGSVYDIHFEETWMDSCDEAEQKKMGQAAYYAYRRTGSTCLILWIVLVILSFIYEFSILPVLLVTCLWGVLQISYITAYIRFNQRGGGRRE